MNVLRQATGHECYGGDPTDEESEDNAHRGIGSAEVSEPQPKNGTQLRIPKSHARSG